MKTLVMAMVFAASNLVNGLAGNHVENKCAYNHVEVNGGQVTPQMVYHVEDGKYLKQHLKYAFCYDAAKEKTIYQLEAANVNYFAFKWNCQQQDRVLMVSHDTRTAQDVQLLAEK